MSNLSNINEVNILAYLKNITEQNIQILSILEKKSQKEISKEFTIGFLKSQISLLEETKTKVSIKEEIDSYNEIIKNSKNKLDDILKWSSKSVTF